MRVPSTSAVRPRSAGRLLTRRAFTASAIGGLATWGISTRAARAATVYKFASNLPASHPLLLRLNEAGERIEQDTNGAIAFKFFPNSQLGGDLEVLAQVRAGAVQFYNMAGAQMSTLVPVASLNGVGFAFNTPADVWKAMDGDVGTLIRKEVSKVGLYVFETMFDNGFRQMTSGAAPIKSPDDLKGLAIRVPPSPLSTSLFKAFGATPQSIGYNEIYTALQTKLVAAQENPLPLIDASKFYEVQKYVSMTNHQWDGFWIVANQAAWEKIPDSQKPIVQKHLREAALAQREDIAKLNQVLIEKLKGLGMTVIEPDRAAFRSALAATSFYADWKQRFGAPAWETLEKYSGKLG
jgi:tripartite ATP-independent transporter DctP family solute receptor